MRISCDRQIKFIPIGGLTKPSKFSLAIGLHQPSEKNQRNCELETGIQRGNMIQADLKMQSSKRRQLLMNVFHRMGFRDFKRLQRF